MLERTFDNFVGISLAFVSTLFKTGTLVLEADAMTPEEEYDLICKDVRQIVSQFDDFNFHNSVLIMRFPG